MEIFRTFEHWGKVLQLATFEDELPLKPYAARAAVSAPGAGQFVSGPLSLSAEKIAPGESLTLKTHISGDKIGYVFSEILFRDPHLEQYYGPVAREFVPAEQSRETLGVSRPVWAAAFELTLTLTPGLRLLTDGVNSAFAFLLPEGYGKSNDQVEGLYTPADGAGPRRALLTFDDKGELKKALVFRGRSGRSAPHALTFKEQDQFSPFVQILTPPAGEHSAWQVKKGLSTTLVVRDQPLRWLSASPLPGAYLAGLLIQDLDGKHTRQYAPFTLAG